jgi:signal transduction histidine kinase
LSKVAALFCEHEADLGAFLSQEGKSRQISGFLTQLSEILLRQREAALAEIAQLQERVNHLKDIVTTQQNYAKMRGKVETLKVADLVEDALKMSMGMTTHEGIRIRKEYDEETAIRTSKTTVLQILVNLIGNAKQACDVSGREEKSLTIRAGNGGDRVRISVSDNGVGIPPENLDRIFTYGFTTKRDGHGFGLHAAAQAAKEMGGGLYVESKGTGAGATFTLELPQR